MKLKTVAMSGNTHVLWVQDQSNQFLGSNGGSGLEKAVRAAKDLASRTPGQFVFVCSVVAAVIDESVDDGCQPVK